MITKIFLKRLIIAIGMIFISFTSTTTSRATSSIQTTKSSINTMATIITTSSTNTCSFTIHVSLITTTDNIKYTTCHAAQGQGSLPQKLTENFFHDIDVAQPLDALPQQICFKSKSFGTNTYIEYGTQKSPDVSCAIGTIEEHLAADIMVIKRVLNVNTVIDRKG